MEDPLKFQGLTPSSMKMGGLRIGSMVTLASLAEESHLQDWYPALADAVRGSASRNVATIGGNLLQRPHCWYFRSRAFNCSAKGASTVLRSRREPVPRDLQQHALCDRPSVDDRHGAGRFARHNAAVQAAHAALEGATPLSENGCKLPPFEGLVRRAILKAAADQ